MVKKNSQEGGQDYPKTVGKFPSGLELKNYEIVLYPLITEKAVNLIEAENKLCFVVNKKANKLAVKKAIEEMYGVRVDKVNVLNDMKGRKKAIVQINRKFKANDIAVKLGVI